MKARVLPVDEWDRITEVPLIPGVPPEDISIVVVEDGNKVVAHMTVFRATHFEGLWIDPKSRNAGVSRSLLRLAAEIAQSWGNGWVFGAAADDRMRDVLTRVGAVKLPVDSYVMSLRRSECRKPS